MKTKHFKMIGGFESHPLRTKRLYKHWFFYLSRAVPVPSLIFLCAFFVAGCGGGGGQQASEAGPQTPFVFVLAGQSQVFDGEVARLLAERIRAKTGRDVIYKNVAASGTQIKEWLPGTANHKALTDAIDTLNASGLPPDALLWMQGESDSAFVANTPCDTYKQRFLDMLAGLRQHTSAPIYVAVETLMPEGITPELQNAQLELPAADATIFAGPDIDTIGYSYRPDRLHLNANGKALAADLWMDKLK
jgi:lysophospholipase L1-like esterase